MSPDAPDPSPPETGNAFTAGVPPVDDAPADTASYASPAGGWAALKAAGRHLLQAGALIRGSRALWRMNQVGGFDCPGCAWPESEHRSRFEYCENGVKAAAAETTTKRVDAAFFQRHSVNDLRQRSDHWLEAQGRLCEPMAYDPESDHYLPIAWDQAFARIGEALRALPSPDAAVFYTSGRTSNEAAFLYQLFGRAFGSNNFPDCSNMCHESSGVALGQSIGVGKGTVLLEDFEQADLILVIGQNPGTNHPRMLSTLQQARQRGAEIVCINPLKERGLERFIHPQHAAAMLLGRSTAIASDYVQPLVGGDLALLTGMIKVVLEAEAFAPGTVLDHAFIDAHCDGFPAFSEHIAGCDWADITRESGIPRERIEDLARRYLGSERVIACWAMGLTQHRHAVPTIQTLVDLMLLRGNLGRPGAGLCPVRGHSNVQGDRTVGITERPTEAFLASLDHSFGIHSPRHHGLDVVAAIEAMAAGQAQVFIGMGGNFVAASPDSAYTAGALRRCALSVQISTKLNRSHLEHGRAALILPCLGRSEIDRQAGGEQQVTVEDSMSVVHASRGRLEPASPLLASEPAIVAGIARATLPDSAVDWEGLVADYSRIRDAIARVLPAFADYNRRIEEPGGFYLGNTARDRDWVTAGGKARFFGHPIPDLRLPEGQLRLMTLRSHDQYNTTIYGLDDRYRGIRNGRRVVLLHPDDLVERGLHDGQHVDLISCFPDRERRAEDFRCVAYDLPRGCAAAYFPEANILVSIASVADGSRTPTSKFIPLRLEARR